MAELLIAIAALCHTGVSQDFTATEKAQLVCQQYYITCSELGKTHINTATAKLIQCVKDNK